ncbi:MAG: hypothetical protein E7057_10825 [Lentisphaerae bacterium]|nr:hypothetical protein [Lentisphaerota bacterium]
MGQYHFDVERDVRRHRFDRYKAIRLLILFVVIAVITAAIIYAIVPEDEKIPAVDTPAAAEAETTPVPPVKTADPDNKPAVTVPGNAADAPTAPGSSGKDAAENKNTVPGDGKSGTADRKDENGSVKTPDGKKETPAAKYDPSTADLFSITNKLRTQLADGSWKKSNFALYHIVCGGDTLNGLAAKYNNTRAFVQKFNNIASANAIRIDQKIYFLQAEKWQVTISRKNGTLQVDRFIGSKAVPFAIFECRINAKGFNRDDLVICSRLVNPSYTAGHGEIFKNNEPQNPYGGFLISLASAKRPQKPIYPLSIHDCKNQEHEATALHNGATVLNNEDISLLYTLVPEGTPVRIVE